MSEQKKEYIAGYGSNTGTVDIIEGHPMTYDQVMKWAKKEFDDISDDGFRIMIFKLTPVKLLELKSYTEIVEVPLKK